METKPCPMAKFERFYAIDDKIKKAIKAATGPRERNATAGTL
jgi:hypothetical protein